MDNGFCFSRVGMTIVLQWHLSLTISCTVWDCWEKLVNTRAIAKQVGIHVIKGNKLNELNATWEIGKNTKWLRGTKKLAGWSRNSWFWKKVMWISLVKGKLWQAENSGRNSSASSIGSGDCNCDEILEAVHLKRKCLFWLSFWGFGLVV